MELTLEGYFERIALKTRTIQLSVRNDFYIFHTSLVAVDTKEKLQI